MGEDGKELTEEEQVKYEESFGLFRVQPCTLPVNNPNLEPEWFGPVATGGKGWAYIRIPCLDCGVQYDRREVEEHSHPTALHVSRFKCPKGHLGETRREWEAISLPPKKHLDKLSALIETRQTPEEKLNRRAFSACITTKVKFCGVQDGVCYFEVYSEQEEDQDKPGLRLSVHVQGLTIDEIIRKINEERDNNGPT